MRATLSGRIVGLCALVAWTGYHAQAVVGAPQARSPDAVSRTAFGIQETVEPPVATPSFLASIKQAPQGGSVDVVYRFVMAPDAPSLDQNYSVRVRFVDPEGKDKNDRKNDALWTDDHDPPVPTSQWRPGQVIEYTRTMFVPVRPYLKTASVEIGLYSVASNSRLKLSGHDSGERSYLAGKLDLLQEDELESRCRVLRIGLPCAITE